MGTATQVDQFLIFFLSFGPECLGPIYLSKMLLYYSSNLDEFLLVVEISKIESLQVVAPHSQGPSCTIYPGYEARRLNPSIVYGTEAEDLPLANSSLVFFLGVSVVRQSRITAKVLVLVQFILFY